MIDKEKIIKWKKSIEHIKGLYGYVTESDDLLLQFCEQYLSGKLVELVKNKINKISKIEQYRNELLNELEKEFENHYWNSVQRDKEIILLHIKQKFAEMRG